MWCLYSSVLELMNCRWEWMPSTVHTWSYANDAVVTLIYNTSNFNNEICIKYAGAVVIFSDMKITTTQGLVTTADKTVTTIGLVPGHHLPVFHLGDVNKWQQIEKVIYWNWIGALLCNTQNVFRLTFARASFEPCTPQRFNSVWWGCFFFSPLTKIGQSLSF